MGKKKNTKQQKRKQQKAQRRKKRKTRHTGRPRDPAQESISSHWANELQSDGRFEDAEFVVNPEGEEKMSGALVDIMGEYAEFPDTQDEMDRVLLLAASAWNAALQDEAGVNQVLDDTLATINAGDEVLAEVEALFMQMVDAKKKLHPDNKRYIIDAKVVDRGDDFHISVISNLTPPN